MAVSDDKKMTAFINSNGNAQGYNDSLGVKIYILPSFGSMKTLPCSGSLTASSSSKNGITPDWAGWNAQLFRNHLRQHSDDFTPMSVYYMLLREMWHCHGRGGYVK